MTAPRVEIDLNKIRRNARILVRRLRARRITVTGVTKAVCGHPDVAQAMLDAGVVGLADARVTNIRRMRDAGLTCPISLIRAPMQSEIKDVVQYCDTSYNTEIDTILGLAISALRQGKVHNVVLMLEMGDMREGIAPEDIRRVISQVAKISGVALKGIAANFACLGNVAPTMNDMMLLSRLASEAESTCGPLVELVSGGSSANLPWALSEGPTGRINDLRLGEAILLGVDPLTGQPIDELYTDAFVLFAEVIETKSKPRDMPVNSATLTSRALRLVRDADHKMRSILAVGQQDTDTNGLRLPAGLTYIGATSDHTVIDTDTSTLSVGSEIKMDMNYSALMRAMSAPDVTKSLLHKNTMSVTNRDRGACPHLTLV